MVRSSGDFFIPPLEKTEPRLNLVRRIPIHLLYWTVWIDPDGQSDSEDAPVLFDLFDDMSVQPGYERFIGGLGKYRANASHGPFIHVDVRGFRARW
ncbi:MAG TPA: hypothetical protein PKN04_14825 [bacterium]|nr:hypothetical protein [bacterium]HNT67055.1 hypothetical protein [bacterium]HOX85091.1 hypothetical protein [bacterium]HPG44044.1 hypothetical protein [bacterium]HPM96411.1 hypothetical protein [bacterium]